MKNGFLKLDRYKKNVVVMFALLMATGCIEEFKAKTESFESLLVVEAVLTNENKKHTIKLSRTFRFEEYNSAPEQFAVVSIKDTQNSEYLFIESNPGIYTSVTEFSAQAEVGYTLYIETGLGEKYISKSEIFKNGAEIENIYAEEQMDEEGKTGIGVFLDSNDPIGETDYYRFEYEETYKIIVPKWDPNDLIISSEALLTFTEVPKTKEIQVCYSTNYSDKNILKSSVGLNSTKLLKTPIRFINKEDYMISNRYSIFIKQYSVSREAYTFYKDLNDFSGNQSLFSQRQPGFLQGNISSVNNENNVIGFFDVSSVTSKRLFFNYRDFFDFYIFSYPYECNTIQPVNPAIIKNLIDWGYVYVGINYCTIAPTIECDFTIPQGPYLFVSKECGDCTVIGTNIKPNFWID
ncbi:DUF4249 domain-containing protein [Cellulophaga sp. F20128]|uniref:DUF4249 domain-containing protein n=1 Tax=Cellulophaga sp. F20128 TaxID=2926413 RepID=UPI001FF605A0|nr:DUF4249 domain-containing protein [Cellulophaga sp. F20128]MCK0156688.1 DUF4249 domain-containing protein [Cellulophaga sp. F20128]